MTDAGHAPTVKQMAGRFGVRGVDVIVVLMRKGIMSSLEQELDETAIVHVERAFRGGSGDDDGAQGAGVPQPRPRPSAPGSVQQ